MLPSSGITPARRTGAKPEPESRRVRKDRRLSSGVSSGRWSERDARARPWRPPQTQRHSEISTSSPCRPKKTRKLRGETRMGRQSRKYRALSKGHSAATPSPPLVMASSRMWLAAAAKPTPKAAGREQRSQGARAAPNSPMSSAKSREWEKPLCPSRSA